MLYKTYGDNALEILREDPYKLITLSILDFKEADYIAKDLKIKKDSKIRILAAIRYVIDSHPPDQKLYADILLRDSANLLENVDEEEVEEIISYAIENSLISVNSPIWELLGFKTKSNIKSNITSNLILQNKGSYIQNIFKY